MAAAAIAVQITAKPIRLAPRETVTRRAATCATHAKRTEHALRMQKATATRCPSLAACRRFRLELVNASCFDAMKINVTAGSAVKDDTTKLRSQRRSSINATAYD